MEDRLPSAAGTGNGARGSMVELVAWAARLEEEIRDFAGKRALSMPPVVYRFSHPARRALPTARIGIKLWEVYPPICSESGVWEIHIHPRQTDPRAIVLDGLRGLASALAGSHARFGSDYEKAAAKLGLAPGPSGRKRGGVSWRHAIDDPRSSPEIDAIAASLGAFPLGALDASKVKRWYPDRNLRKAICPTCGPSNARLSRKAFAERLFLCGGLREAPHAPVEVVLGPDVAVAAQTALSASVAASESAKASRSRHSRSQSSGYGRLVLSTALGGRLAD